MIFRAFEGKADLKRALILFLHRCSKIMEWICMCVSRYCLPVYALMVVAYNLLTLRNTIHHPSIKEKIATWVS
jgi:hypothetical protein